MTLTREEAGELGLAFSQEGDSFSSDPEVPVFQADATIDGHTERFTGKSEEEVLARFEALRAARGLDRQTASPQDAATSDSDVHDQRNDNDDPI